MAKFTAGPWRVDRGPFFLQVMADAAGVSGIATVQAVSPSTAQAFANARLIAEAPSLLEVLEAVRDGAVIDLHTHRATIEGYVLDKVRAAIARATPTEAS